MPASDAQLRDVVRSLVTAALERLQTETPPSPAPVAASSDGAPASGAAGRRPLLVLFMSREQASDDFFAQIQALGAQGYGYTAAFSRSFEQAGGVKANLSRLPAATPFIGSDSPEGEWAEAVRRCVGVLCPNLSINTAAKLAAGIDDSLPSLVLRDALLDGKPVFVARDLPQLEREAADKHPGAAPALLRASTDACHRAQMLGIRFVDPSRLTSEVTGAFYQPVNETPDRLARTKPSLRRAFVTAEDVYTAAAAGHKELAHPPDAIVTDAARDEAATRGIVLAPRPA